MDSELLYKKALELVPLTADEGVFLYENAPLGELMYVGNKLRQLHNPGNYAGWMIERGFARPASVGELLAILGTARERGLSLGAARFLFRPLEPEQLLAEVESCLAEKAAAVDGNRSHR